jgi:Tat protein secretion system quality control protein TatD with DNase activity
MVLTDEYQCGATTTLAIHHATGQDNGTYTLQAENRNGTEKIDLDLIVPDHLPKCDYDMYRRGDKQCSCHHSYTGPDETLKKLMDVQFNESFLF